MPSIVAEVSEAERTSKDDIQQLILLGGYLFSGDYGGNITKWTLDLKCVKQWRAHEYQVYCLVGDESHLISSSSNGEIKKWNSETGDLIHTEIMKNRYDEDSATEVKSLHVKDGLLYAGDDKGTINRYDRNFRRDRQKSSYSEVWSIATSPDGKTVFSAKDNIIVASDLALELAQEQYQDSLGVQFTLEGRAPVIVNEDFVVCGDKTGMKGLVYKNNAQEKHPLVGELLGHDMIVNAIVFHGSQVVTAGWDGRVKLWNTRDLAEVAQIELGFYVNALCSLSIPDQIVIAGGKDGQLVKIEF